MKKAPPKKWPPAKPPDWDSEPFIPSWLIWTLATLISLFLIVMLLIALFPPR